MFFLFINAFILACFASEAIPVAACLKAFRSFHASNEGIAINDRRLITASTTSISKSVNPFNLRCGMLSLLLDV